MKESQWELARKRFKKTNEKGYGLIHGIISLLAGLLLTVLALRFVFRLLGANPANGFVNWVYDVSHPFVAPFFGIFHQDAVNLATGTFEIATLVALLVYGLIASILLGAFSWPYRRTTV